MMLPFPLSYVKIAGAIALVIGAFFAGWVANGWRLYTEIAEMQAQYANAEALAAKAALNDLVEATSAIKKAADEYAAIETHTSSKIDKLRKEVQQYAKENPLPADCKPDLRRQEILHKAIEEANAAITK